MAGSRPETLWTVARIAEHLRVARHRVEYIIDSRAIEPLGTARIARVFRSEDVRQIAAELRDVDSRKGAGRDG